jgi:hypothetical protein
MKFKLVAANVSSLQSKRKEPTYVDCYAVKL